MVREKPIINDATWDDAISVGLDKVAAIVSSGSDAPATILSRCSPQMLALYRSADTIIAKGQGNYESLSGEKGNIFFMLKAKCPVVARLLEASVGDAILLGRSSQKGKHLWAAGASCRHMELYPTPTGYSPNSDDITNQS